MDVSSANPISPQIKEISEIENQKQIKKVLKKRTIKSYILVILGSMLYSIGVAWVLQLGEFYSSGVTGISQVIIKLPTLFGGGSLDAFLGLLIGLINVPLVVWSWKGVSKRFAILTVVSIVTQTLFTTILTNFTMSPFVALLDGSGDGIVDAIKSGKLNIFIKNFEAINEFRANIETGDMIILAIIGGGITGFGSSLCLKSGGSTGGIDVVSSYLQMKKHTSFTKYQSMIDVIIIAVSSIFSVEKVLYTLIRLYVSLKIVDLLYNSYKITRLEVITTKGEELRLALIKDFHHGITIFEAVGGYTMVEKKVLEMYVSAYEVHDYLRIINVIDPGAFIVSTNVRIIGGKYIQKTIV